MCLSQGRFESKYEKVGVKIISWLHFLKWIISWKISSIIFNDSIFYHIVKGYWRNPFKKKRISIDVKNQNIFNHHQIHDEVFYMLNSKLETYKDRSSNSSPIITEVMSSQMIRCWYSKYHCYNYFQTFQFNETLDNSISPRVWFECK